MNKEILNNISELKKLKRNTKNNVTIQVINYLLDWIEDHTGLDGEELARLVMLGFLIVTNESVTAVHLYAFDHNDSPVKQIF